MYYATYYLNKGCHYTLEELLNLDIIQKEFLIESMNFELENKMKFEEMKLKALGNMLGGGEK